MVKKTLVVLGILSMTIVIAGTAFGFHRHQDDCGPALPLFVATCCPEIEYQQVVKTWSCKIEGPCPPPGMPACGSCDSKRKGGGLSGIATALGAPLDVLFGGGHGVYGCKNKRGGGGRHDCIPSYGALPGLTVAGPIAITGMIFETLW